MPLGFKSRARAPSQAMGPGAGAGLGASPTAPGGCVARFLQYMRRKNKEMSEPRYARFYPPSLVSDVPVSYSAVAEVCGNGADIKTAVGELEAASKLLRHEYDSASAYLGFLEYYVNLPWDVVEEDFHLNVQMLRNLLRLHEQEYEKRKVEEVATRSGKKLYLKVRGGKVVVFGDTYPIKDELKKLGFKWDPAERVWYTPVASDINVAKAKLEVL
jgi:ribonuclease BN (tRNA processing enzyme)